MILDQALSLLRMRVSKTNLATEQVLSVRALNLLQPHGAPSRVCVLRRHSW